MNRAARRALARLTRNIDKTASPDAAEVQEHGPDAKGNCLSCRVVVKGKTKAVPFPCSVVALNSLLTGMRNIHDVLGTLYMATDLTPQSFKDEADPEAMAAADAALAAELGLEPGVPAEDPVADVVVA